MTQKYLSNCNMLFKLLFALLKNLRWVISIAIVLALFYTLFTQYNSIKKSPLGGLLPSITLPAIPSFTGTPTATIVPTLPESTKVTIQTEKGDVTYTAEVAADPTSQAVGLMYRTSLPQYSGMYFIYDQDVFHGFWMKNCEIPLDMLFIDATGTIIEIREDVRPCKESDPEQRTCPTYVPSKPYRSVLEINAKSAQQNGIKVGHKIVTTLK